MIRNSHRRNSSEAIRTNSKPQTLKPRARKTCINGNNTLSLLEQSSNKINGKRTIVEQLDQTDNTPDSPFFAFGQGAPGHKNWHLDIDRISEAMDSNSRRDFTTHRSARQDCSGQKNCHSSRNKEKSQYRDNSYNSQNREKGRNKQNFNSSNLEETNLAKSRGAKGRPKQRQKSQRNKSTMSLPRKNSKELECRTRKMEKSVKMLWECIGQLWENSRVSQYKSERNSEGLNGLKKRLEEQEQKILDIKFDIGRMEKPSDRVKQGIRV